MHDLIPAPYPANTWRGFLTRVATIAVAALIVLGTVDFVEYVRDSHAPHARHTQPEIDQQTDPFAPLQPKDTP